MSPAYRKASQHTFMWLVICFGGLAGEMLVFYACYAAGLQNRLQAWVFIPAALPFFAALAFGWWRLARLNRARINGLMAAMEPLGFLMSPEPQPETKASFWISMERVMACLGMNRGGEAVQWLALRGEAGNRMAAWEYRYTTGSGKSLQVHEFTAVAWPADHPALPPGLAQMPGCQIQRMDWLQRRARRKEEIVLPGMEVFRKKWAVYGNASTAARVLTPEWVSQLDQSPKREGWHVGEGWVCCCAKSTLDGENFRRFLNHAEQLVKSLR